MAIAPLSPHACSLLQSGQAAVTPEGAVKELLENAIDAGASSVDVVLVAGALGTHGSLVVRDNGPGISSSDAQLAATAHCTSKIASFHDMTFLRSYGFRGEALSSIAAVSGSLHIDTRCTDEDSGRHYVYATNGTVASVSPIAANVGTVVTVGNLFAAMPVRRQTLMKRIPQINKKVRHLVTAYSLIYPQIRFQLKITPSKNIDDYLSKPVFSSEDTLKTIYHIYPKLNGLLQGVEVDLPLSTQNDSDNDSNDNCKDKSNASCGRETPDKPHSATLKVIVPKNGTSLTGFEEHFHYVNSRPVSMRDNIMSTALSKIREAFKASLRGTSSVIADDTKLKLYFSFMHINLPSNRVDVNVEPDKSTVFIHDVDVVMRTIDTAMAQAYPGGIAAAFLSINAPTTQTAQNRRETTTPTRVNHAVSSTSSNVSSSSTAEDLMSNSYSALPRQSPTAVASSDIGSSSVLVESAGKRLTNMNTPVIQTQLNFPIVCVPPISSTVSTPVHSGFQDEGEPSRTSYKLIGQPAQKSILSFPSSKRPITVEAPPIVANKRIQLEQRTIPRSLFEHSHESDSTSQRSSTSDVQKIVSPLRPSNTMVSVPKEIPRTPSKRHQTEFPEAPVEPRQSPYRRTKGIVVEANSNWDDAIEGNVHPATKSRKSQTKFKYPKVIGFVTTKNGSVTSNSHAIVKYVCPGTESADSKNLWLFSLNMVEKVILASKIERDVGNLNVKSTTAFEGVLRELWICIAASRRDCEERGGVELKLVSSRKRTSDGGIFEDHDDDAQLLIDWLGRKIKDVNCGKEIHVLRVSVKVEQDAPIGGIPRLNIPAEATLTGSIAPESEFHSHISQHTTLPIALKLM